MKIAIITDQHFGARKNSKLFHDYFLKFYNDIFFPYLEEHGITTIVDMGDTFDSRKGIDFSALSWAKNNYYDRLADMGIHIHTIVGNHTAYYKNTNEVNAVDLLLREYDNVTTYSKATEVVIDKLNVLFIPWINQENEEETLKLIQSTTSSCAMGHLELTGFRAHRGCIMDHGMSSMLFEKFSHVFSGHYHTRSDDGRIYYLGNPYEMFWNDVGDRRGFTIFDTETLEHFHVDNPYRMFYNVYYEDTPHQMFDVSEFNDKIVKVIVRKKSDSKKFEKFIDKLYAAGVSDLKIVENFQVIDDESFEAFESEDTLSILNRYIEEAEFTLDKAKLQNFVRSVYQEACELV
jgi:DNA repair exonuclease SbcCD nuclease subunit|tara:strand:- start:1207 stop:2247 length:1041 start_codon:yes stop_codon:yes gene_type:complete